MAILLKIQYTFRKITVHLSLAEWSKAKPNERDDKWFLEFPNEMVECEMVVIVNIIMWLKCEKCANCKDASI